MRRTSFSYFILIAALAFAPVACDSSSPTEPAPVPCSFSVSPTSVSVGAPGGPASVTVTAASNCAWTATSDRGWMSITSGSSGSGNGTVSVTLTANPNEAVRTGTLTVAGQSVAVQQAGLGACTIDISPGSASFNKDEATASFAVTAAAHCTWSATSAAGWLRVTSGSPGTGNGTVGYAIERNRSADPRAATIAVGGRTFTVNQAGDPPAPPACQYSVSPIQFNPCMSVPNALTSTVTTQDGCTWTASPGAPWISVTGGQSGTGSGVVSFTVTDNYDAPRNGVVQIRWPTETAGQNLQVSQAGCFYAVSTAAIAMPIGGGTGQFSVIQQSDPLTCGGATQDRCRWTAVSDVPWITITTSMPQAGDNPVNFTVAANPGNGRTGTITVRDKIVRINQSGI